MPAAISSWNIKQYSFVDLLSGANSLVSVLLNLSNRSSTSFSRSWNSLKFFLSPLNFM